MIDRSRKQKFEKIAQSATVDGVPVVTELFSGPPPNTVLVRSSPPVPDAGLVKAPSSDLVRATPAAPSVRALPAAPSIRALPAAPSIRALPAAPAVRALPAAIEMAGAEVAAGAAGAQIGTGAAAAGTAGAAGAQIGTGAAAAGTAGVGVVAGSLAAIATAVAAFAVTMQGLNYIEEKLAGILENNQAAGASLRLALQTSNTLTDDQKTKMGPMGFIGDQFSVYQAMKLMMQTDEKIIPDIQKRLDDLRANPRSDEALVSLGKDINFLKRTLSLYEEKRNRWHSSMSMEEFFTLCKQQSSGIAAGFGVSRFADAGNRAKAAEDELNPLVQKVDSAIVPKMQDIIDAYNLVTATPGPVPPRPSATTPGPSPRPRSKGKLDKLPYVEELQSKLNKVVDTFGLPASLKLNVDGMFGQLTQKTNNAVKKLIESSDDAKQRQIQDILGQEIFQRISGHMFLTPEQQKQYDDALATTTTESGEVSGLAAESLSTQPRQSFITSINSSFYKTTNMVKVANKLHRKYA